MSEPRGLIPPRFSKMRGAMFTPARADAYIEAVATGSEDKEAAEYAGLSMTAVRDRISRDPDFRAAVAAARRNRIEVYRSEARRRAVEGFIEPVFYRGKQVGKRRVYSDRMLELLLKAEDPDTFGDRQVVTVLAAPMSGQDVTKALEAGRIEGAAEVLEKAAALFADLAELPETVEGEYEDSEG